MHAVKEPQVSRSSQPEGTEVGNLLGRLLVDQGKIENRDIPRIVKHARKKKLRFGEAAKDLKLISKTDLEHAMAEQFDYPFLKRGEGGLPKELVAAFAPFSKKGQALRNLRARLLQHWGDQYVHQALAIVGAAEDEGCSYIAANLAVVFSQLGQRTLLVDCDMRNGRQHDLFRIKNNVGLSAALMGRANIGQVIKRLTLFRNLYILPAGAAPPNVAELFGRRELSKVVGQLRDNFDIVIFDTPPASENSGADLVAAACGNALLVVRKNKTRVAEAEGLVDAVRATGGNIVGSVMNKF
jgi:receptor protein-tyrosine kinase